MDQRVALVTGGGHGIGRAVVHRLIQDGFTVFVMDVDVEAANLLSEDPSARVIAAPGDAGREKDVLSTLKLVERRSGRLDLLVNNAGISDFTPLENAGLDHWNRVLAVNLTGPFLLAKHASSILAASKGSIVNIASTRAMMSEAGTEAYSASKGGLVALTHALAVSLGPKVRVNCISPGWIDVSGTKLRPEDNAQHPAGRVGRPEDVAALISWLASDEAGFMTGANLTLDGGMTRKMIYVE